MGLWALCWNQDAIVAVDGEKISSTKRSTDESVKDQGDVGCVFWLERHYPSLIFTTWSDGKQTFVPRSFSAFEGAVRMKRPDCGETTLGCCTTTMRRLARPSSSTVIWQNIRHPLCPIHPTLRTLSQQTSSFFPNLKPLWKDVVSKP